MSHSFTCPSVQVPFSCSYNLPEGVLHSQSLRMVDPGSALLLGGQDSQTLESLEASE